MKLTKFSALFFAVFLLIVSLYSISVSAEVTDGAAFNSEDIFISEKILDKAPVTTEATIYFPSDTSASTRGGVIVGNYKDSDTPCYSVEIHKNGNPRLYLDLGAGTSAIDFIFNKVNVYTGEWLKLAIVTNSSEDTASCYINGVLKQTISLSSPKDLTLTTPLCLGGDERSGNTQYFKGRIKDVAIYSDVRSSAEIATDYSSSEIDRDNLIGFYTISSGEDTFADKFNAGPTFKAEIIWFSEKAPITDYAYSLAVVGDTQKLLVDHPDKFPMLYDWLVDNAEEKKMQYVIGLGDITDDDLDWEWKMAVENINKLNGVVPYSLVRGNHDSVAQYNKYLNYSDFGSTVTGSYNNDMLNTYHKFTVGETKYMIFCFDIGPSDDILEWASEIITNNPDHNVIISTHIYLYRDGTTLDAGDSTPATKCGGVNNGDDIWEKLVSKHENIVLVLSGHDPNEKIITSYAQGENGNIVTQMLIDPQNTDKNHGGVGMVAMLYFSEDGTIVDVEYYSTIREQYMFKDNQFQIKLDNLTHDYTEWTTTDEEHWVKCGDCEDVAFKGKHTGGMATFNKKAVCDVCGSEYGEFGERIVIYVADKATGKGDGSSPNDAIGRVDGYDNTKANAFKGDALYRAITLNDNEIIKKGGYIVFVGETTLDNADALRTTSHAEWRWPSEGVKNTIIFTSKYDGVDYREKGAKLVFDTSKSAINFHIDSPTIWQDINVESKYDSSRSNGKNDIGIPMISFCGNETVIGENVKVTTNDITKASNKYTLYPNLVGFMRLGLSDAVNKTDTSITVYSGNWNAIYGGGYGHRTGAGVQFGTVKGNVNVSIYGGEIGTVYGTSSHRAENLSAKVIGNVNILIDGGKVGEVYASNHNGVDGRIELVITDKATGLTKAWGYYPTSSNADKAPKDATIKYSSKAFESLDIKYFTNVAQLVNKNGWIEENGVWYYYENNVKVKNSWREDSTGWCFLDEEGRWVLNSFVKDSTNKWAYITKDGYYYETTGWVEYDGHWYYLEKGYRVENDWRKDSTGWCFLDEEGKWVLNSFVKDSTGMWAYITPDGYYYETTGWIEYDGGWYYLEKGYAVTSQWRKDSIGWCYLSESGRMVTNDFVADSMGLCYIGGEGYMLEVTGWQLHNDQWYYLQNGYAVTNDWRLDSKGWCYLGEDGAMLTSTWFRDSVGWCYIDENGYCLANGTYEVDGHEYTFDADGRIEGEPIQE